MSVTSLISRLHALELQEGPERAQTASLASTTACLLRLSCTMQGAGKAVVHKRRQVPFENPECRPRADPSSFRAAVSDPGREIWCGWQCVLMGGHRGSHVLRLYLERR